MKRNIVIIAFSFAIASLSAKNNTGLPQGFEEQKTIGIAFTENKGQVVDQNYNARPDVLFGGQNKGLTFHLRNNGISYQLNRIDSWKEEEDHKTKEKRKKVDQQTIYRIDINWLNANTRSLIQKKGVYDGVNNFYTEGCPEGGALNVRSYKEVTYQSLYTGIDLKWYEKNGELKYDYLCAAGSDYKQIKLQLIGAESAHLNNKGELLIKTPLGTIIEKAPVVMQQDLELKSTWVLKNNTLSFEIHNLNQNLPYVIDPAVRVWGTYYGGTGMTEGGYSCITDGSGNVYLAGQTSSSAGTIIATAGSHQSIFGTGYDAFLVKFNALGVRQWASYYGGAGIDGGVSCATDGSGNVYLAGITQSNTGTVIATAGSHQSTIGGNDDAFLVKFNTLGVRQWGTYYGGTGTDVGNACATDGSGNVYLAGRTSSITGTAIGTAGSHQSTIGGNDDAFLVKFSSLGVRQWGTYYGGTGFDYGYSCITDGLGNVYLSGYSASNSGTVIATAGSHQSTFGGTDDAFLVKFNSLGARQWGTYYGGSGFEYGYSCTTDGSGNVYLAGYTSSNTGTAIATTGSHQSAFGGIDDAFLVKFNTSGVRQWGSYYGGSGSENGYFCSTDGSGNVYLAGYTQSNTGTVIATAGSHQSTFGGSSDAYLVKFNTSGIRQWGTYYGGAGDDRGWSCCTDGSSNLYLVGNTSSNIGTVISTVGSHQSIFGGGSYDAFLVKFKDCMPLTPTVAVNGTACAGATINFTANVTGTATPTYSWSGPNTFTSNIQNPSITNAGTVNIGVYTLTVINNAVCMETATTQINTVNPQPAVSAVSSASNFICVGQSATLTANGATSYTWNPGGTGSLLIISPTVSTNYTVIGTGANGCNNTAVVSQSVSACTIVDEAKNNFPVIEIYPNPVHDLLSINLGSVDFTTVKVEVINSIGQVVLLSNVTSNQMPLNVSQLASGIYIVKVVINKETIKHKLIKN